MTEVKLFTTKYFDFIIRFFDEKTRLTFTILKNTKRVITEGFL